jgi:hypothetical protein
MVMVAANIFNVLISNLPVPSGEGALALSDGCQLRCHSSVMPGHQLVQPSDLVARDATESVGEPCLRINAVQLCGLDQRIGDGGGFGRAF